VTLTGRSTGGTTLNDANRITDLGAFTNSGGGNFSLTDTTALAVTGVVSAGSGNLSLNVGGPLTLASDLDAGGTVSLTAGGAITQAAGTIHAANLTGSSVGGASLGDVNDFAASSGFTNTGGGNLLLKDDPTLTLTGSFKDAGGNLKITALRDINAQNISVIASNATFDSAGSVTLNGGTFTLTDSLTVTARANIAATNISLVAVTADISAAGAVVLNGGNFNVTDRIFIGSTMGITETGTATFTTQLVIFDATGAPVTAAAAVNRATGPSLVATYVPGADSANILLANITAPNSSVLLAANHGRIAVTNINANVLGIVGQFGSAEMFGTVGGIFGPTAAQNVGKSGLRDNNYRFNNCAVGSITCIVLPEIVPVKPVPAQNITVLRQQQFNDPTINLLNVGDEDLVLTSEATPDSDGRQ
jgi:hypothetical protein